MIATSHLLIALSYVFTPLGHTMPDLHVVNQYESESACHAKAEEIGFEPQTYVCRPSPSDATKS